MVYDELSPFTNNRRVLIEPDADKNDYIKLCMDTGYHTYDIHWKVGSDIIDIVESGLPNIIIDTKRIVGDNVWYRLLLITPFILLTPEYSGDNINWAIYTLKDADPNVDNVIMTIEDDEHKPIYRTIDPDTKKVFPENQFEQAMDMFQVIGASIYGKIAELSKTEEEHDS